MVSLEQARQKKLDFHNLYLSADRAPYVNGCGITRILPHGGAERVYAIKVNLRSALPTGFDLPDEFEGMHVITEVIGQVNAQSTPTS